MKKFLNDFIPKLWGVCWILIITAASFGIAVWFTIWVLSMLSGVIQSVI